MTMLKVTPALIELAVNATAPHYKKFVTNPVITTKSIMVEKINERFRECSHFSFSQKSDLADILSIVIGMDIDYHKLKKSDRPPYFFCGAHNQPDTCGARPVYLFLNDKGTGYIRLDDTESKVYCPDDMDDPLTMSDLEPASEEIIRLLLNDCVFDDKSCGSTTAFWKATGVLVPENPASYTDETVTAPKSSC